MNTPSITRRWRGSVTLHFSLLFLAVAVSGQAPLQDMFYTAATTTHDAAGRHWAYLVWDATTPGLLAGRQYAIYAKAGDPLSPALYERKSLVQRQTDPRVIDTLLNRAVNLGENPAVLDDEITKLFRTMTNAMSLPLPEKISAVIRGSSGNHRFEANLRLLARAHPALAMILGLGHAELFTGTTGTNTFEVREFDPGKGRDIGVVGRVTVIAGVPLMLPAPGAPVRSPEMNPKGHLNAKLRWATPDDLRRLSLLNFGFNVWRMTREFSESRNIGSNAPATATLVMLAATHTNEVRKVNRMPVLPPRDFDSNSVANFTASGDTNTFFMADDNDRFRGGMPFKDGQEFYYYVTARDLLGRDGAVSRGTLVMLCGLMPPNAPIDVQVENDYSYTAAPKQVLKVSWPQLPNSPPGYTNSLPTNIVAYHIYRWSNQVEMLAKESDPGLNRIAIVPYVAGTNRGGFIDDGPGSPNMVFDVNKTFWYTVRAVDGGVCRQNLSPHSGMAYGVLRDRVGPEPPTGGVEINCANPVASVVELDVASEANLDPALGYFRLSCQRLHAQLAWADFKVRVNPVPEIQPTAVEYDLGRVEFSPTSGEAAVKYSLSRTLTENGGGSVTVSCRVGISDELVSPWVSYTYDRNLWLPAPSRAGILFEGRINVSGTLVEGPKAVRLSPPLFRQTLVNFFTLLGTPGVTAGAGRIQISTDLISWTDLTTASIANYSGQLGVTGPYIPLQDSSVFTERYRFYRVVPTNYSVTVPCKHFPYAGNNIEGTNTDLIVTLGLTPTTKEFKIYRRIDDGPLTLFSQGTNDYEVTQIVRRKDEAVPAGASKVCFFAQLFDEHGNPSALTPVADCITIIRPPPCPSLSAIEPIVGPNGQKQMIIRWACSTNGVERFKFFLAPEQGYASNSPSRALSANLLAAGLNPQSQISFVNAEVEDVATSRAVPFLGAHLTGPIGSEIGWGPKFSLTLDVDEGREYVIKIKAVGRGGLETAQCNPERKFKWAPPPSSPFPQVQWPARPLPPANEGPAFVAALMAANRRGGFPPVTSLAALDPVYPVGIKIGSSKFKAYIGFSESLTNAIPEVRDPLSVLFAPPKGNVTQFSEPGSPTVLPIALYRTQLPNAAFPVVSGDVAQSSPLMEKIAYRFVEGDGPDFMVIKDPFVRVVYTEMALSTGGGEDRLLTSDLYLLDTQPVLAGAAYHYMLVRFKPNGEINQTISAGNVTIPAN